MALTRDQVVDAGLWVLEAHGLDGVSMRAVAQRLEVQHNSVRWHVESKARLLELMADALLRRCCDGPLPTDWRQRVTVLTARFRTALLRCTDGARLATGVVTVEPNTMRYTDTVLEALIAGGLSVREATWTHFAIFYFTLGLTQEQQSTQPPVLIEPAQTRSDQYPVLATALTYLNDGSFDDRFNFGVNQLLTSKQEPT